MSTTLPGVENSSYVESSGTRTSGTRSSGYSSYAEPRPSDRQSILASKEEEYASYGEYAEYGNFAQYKPHRRVLKEIRSFGTK